MRTISREDYVLQRASDGLSPWESGGPGDRHVQSCDQPDAVRIGSAQGTRTADVSPHTRSPFAAHKTLRDYMSDYLVK